MMGNKQRYKEGDRVELVSADGMTVFVDRGCPITGFESFSSGMKSCGVRVKFATGDEISFNGREAVRAMEFLCVVMEMGVEDAP